MADIVLKNASGEDVTYSDVESITVNTTEEGVTATYTLGGGTSVNADWNQTDSTQPDYIKNKPFGEENEIVEILPSTTYSNFRLDSTYGVYACKIPSTYTLTIGKTYYILWDGIAYECVSQDASALVSGSVILGNASSFGLDGNNEPFIIASIAGTGAQYCALTDTEAGNSHTVSITTDGVVVKKIESKYFEFMDTFSEKIILAEQDLTFNLYKENSEEPEKSIFVCDMSSEAHILSFYGVTPGSKVRVVFDETEYNLSAVDVSGEFAGLPVIVDKAFCIGNSAMYGTGEDTGEPFCIGLIVTDVQEVCGCYAYHTSADESFSCPVSVTQHAYSVINEKYLPSNIGGSALPEVTTNDAGKFLRVSSDGDWAVESIPNAEEATF